MTAYALPPGSEQALKAGCRCPVLDNGRGAGSGQFNERGEPMYWINGDCPIHGLLKDETKEREEK